MQQTALNLIAIGVFLLTMSSLLTPVLPISPAVPAAVTFFVLSLATLDTLSWQGKGVTLLLDGVARISPQYRQRIVHHEAGHFLVAYFLGIPITDYSLSAWEAFRKKQSGAGGVSFNSEALFEKTTDFGEARLLLERFCTVWMAGIAAEILVYEQAEGGAEDRQKIRAALANFGRPSQESIQKQRWAQMQATNLIEKHWDAYQALVEAMSNRASVAECSQVIQQH